MQENPTRLVERLRSSTAARYSFSICVIAIATFIRWALNPLLGNEFVYIVAYFAVMVVAWVGGLGPAVLGVVLGILTTDFLLIAPHFSFTMGEREDLISTALFAFVGITVGAMSGAYRRALQRSAESYRLSHRQQIELEQIYSSAPIGLAFLDENLCYLRVNEALASFNGVPSEAHLGRHISEILSGPTAEKIRPVLNQVLTMNTPLRNLEFQGPATHGSHEIRHVRASFYPVELGNLRGIHGVVQDITAEKKAQDELKAVESQLRHAAKMEAVGRLAGGVAHDFNNLLMVISSYTELLLQQLKDQPEIIKKLRAIAGASQRAAGLTKQLLAFSRKQTLQPQVIEVDSLVQNLEPLLRRAVSEETDLVFDLNSKGKQIKADPSQLEQVLMNLAVNARDAMSNRGRLTIQTRIRNLERDDDRSVFKIPAGDYVEMSITDSGCGIAPELQARIFDPFFTTKAPGQGTGLGLAMVYGIVKQSGGYIEVQSTVGQGTTFRIWLPTTMEMKTSATQPTVVTPHGKGTILVVEDEALLRKAISEYLTVVGYQVFEAQDGSEALRMIENYSGKIDLLLSDAVMPRMSGMDLISRVHAAYPSMKVLLMSGYAQGSSSGEASNQAEGTHADVVFMQKPFAHADLAKTVRKLLADTN